MSGTTFTDVYLGPDVDVDQATAYLHTLHGEARGYVSSVCLRDTWPRTRCSFATWEELTREHDPDESRDTLRAVVADRWQVYVACSTFATVPERGRGRGTDVLEVPGVWADLDVKPGAEDHFQTTEEVDAFLARLPEPTMLVDSGSGGRHAYWLYEERLPDVDRARRLLTAWRDHLVAVAETTNVDNVQEVARILRMAGTVRWPKHDGVGPSIPRPVVLLGTGGPRYHPDDVESITHEAHEAARALRRQRRRVRKELEAGRLADIERRGLPAATYADIISVFEDVQDWAPLLEAGGWTLHSDRRDLDGGNAVRYWTRPGKPTESGWSAQTDYEDSKILYLYTRDPVWEGRAELFVDEDHRIVTKYRFALAVLYGGDEGRLLRDIVSGRGRL